MPGFLEEEKYTLTLETITPVHVRGEVFSKHEIWYDKSRSMLCLTDYSIDLTEELAEKILEGEVEILQIMESVVKPKCRERNYIADSMVRVKINDRDSVKQIIENQGVVFLHSLVVPPSIIKGIIRTAVIYYLLDRNKNLREIVVGNIKREVLNAMTRQRRRSRLDIKNLSRKIIDQVINNNAIKLVKNKNKNFDFGYFWKINYETDPLVKTFIGYFGYITLSKYQTRTLNKKILAEFIEPRSKLSFNIKFRNVIRDPSIDNLSWFGELFSYDAKFIRLKINALKEALRIYAQRTYEFYKTKVYSNISKDIISNFSLEDPLPEKDCYVVRIGYGSSHIYKTVRPFMDDLYRSLLEKELARAFRKRRWDLSTEKVAMYWESIEDKQPVLVPVGWVKLCLK